MKESLKSSVKKAILECRKNQNQSDFKMPEIAVDYPKEEKFGDYTTNVAMILAGKTGEDSMKMAKEIVSLLEKQRIDKLERIEIAKPGYINFFLAPAYLQNEINKINKKSAKFGSSSIGKRKKVLIEFISSNPTGPITLGNARGGPLGDTLANVLEKAGYRAEREFYVNDWGNQIDILGHSILGDSKAQYKGEYINDLAARLDKDLKSSREVGYWAAGVILKEIIEPACEKLGVHFDNWFSERILHLERKVDNVIELFKERKLTYEKDGALWYKSAQFGDDKDRVLVKSNGKKTYFAADTAYHQNKFSRGFDKAINIWGADHHGDVLRVKSAVEEVLGQKDKLDFIITQFVRIIKDGKEVRMSKRKGVYFALDDLISEVGKDAVRFVFLSYAPTTHVNFDINLAKERSEKNPVYYVQYAHARIASILARVQSSKFKVQSEGNLSLLSHEKELSLIRELNKFPELVEKIAQSYEVHKLPHYAIKLADKFHNFYESCRVIDEKNPELTGARLILVNAVRIVLAEALRLMGISAPEKM